MAGVAGSIFDQSGGSVSLNGHTLTLDTDCDANFGGSSSNVITGSSTSALVVNSISSSGGVIEANGLFMDQTTTGSTNILSTLTLNGDQTLTIGNTLNIMDSILPKAGTIASGGKCKFGFFECVKNRTRWSNECYRSYYRRCKV